MCALIFAKVQKIIINKKKNYIFLTFTMQFINLC